MPPKKISVKNNKTIRKNSRVNGDSESDTNTDSSTESNIETSVTTSVSDIEKNKYKIIVSLLPNVDLKKDNILKYKIEPEYSNGIQYPKNSLGFHHYINDTKDKMQLTTQFEGKKKVYLVTNQFERYVDDYQDTIDNACIKYFDLTKKPKILSRGFFKLWEILMTFNLIPLENNFTSAHLAEGPGSFIQATMFYRELFSKNYKNDKYYAVTLHPESEEGKHVPPLEEDFIKYYEKESPKRFILHKTYSKQVAGGFDDKDNGDILNPKTIKLFGGQINERVDFITADGGFNWKNENTQEQEAFKLMFAQMVGAIKLQKKGGAFVCKFFETFTILSAKMLNLLSVFYNQVYLIKPLMSRPSNSEKYAVCMDFKFNEKDKEYIDAIKQIDITYEKSFKNKENLMNIFPEFIPSNNFMTCLTNFNTEISNQQFISINAIVKFIEGQNYYGDAYQLFREMQINASKYWISTYLPSKNNLNQIKTTLFDVINNNVKKNDYQTETLMKNLTFE